MYWGKKEEQRRSSLFISYIPYLGFFVYRKKNIYIFLKYSKVFFFFNCGQIHITKFTILPIFFF